MKLKKLLSAALVTSSLFLAGCATIVSNSEYAVNIDSVPQGASFEVLNKAGALVATGKTPQQVVLSAGNGEFFGKERYTLNFKSPKAFTTTIEASLDGWYIGNIFFGWVLGALVVDPLTGAMWKLPSNVKVDLNAERRLTVRNFHDLSDEEKKSLVAVVPAK